MSTVSRADSVNSDRARQSREWLRALFVSVRATVVEWWAEFRARSVYFQLKVLVALLYGGVIAATLLFVPPTSQAKNQIGARIEVLEGDAVVGRYFVVYNEGRDHWYDVRLDIGDGFVVERPLVRAGEQLTLFVKDFKKRVVKQRRGREIPQVMSAPVDRAIEALTVTTRDGEATVVVSGSDGSGAAEAPREGSAEALP